MSHMTKPLRFIMNNNKYGLKHRNQQINIVKGIDVILIFKCTFKICRISVSELR